MKKPTKKPSPLLVAFLVAACVIGTIAYFSADHTAFQDFSKRRAEWFAKCNELRNVPLATSADARSCNSQLDDLMTEARQHGWVK